MGGLLNETLQEKRKTEREEMEKENKKKGKTTL